LVGWAIRLTTPEHTKVMSFRMLDVASPNI